MAAPCLSSVLTNANITMYQNSVPDLSYRSSHTDYMGNTSPVPGQWYGQVSPHCWTPENVLEWISDNIECTNFDARSLSLAYCAVDGPALCKMSRDDMMGVFGPGFGAYLHQSLLKHKAKHDSGLSFITLPELSETCQLLDNFLDKLSFPLLSTITIGQGIQSDGLALKRDLLYGDEYDLSSVNMESLAPLTDHEYPSDQHSDSEYSSSSNTISNSTSLKNDSIPMSVESQHRHTSFY